MTRHPDERAPSTANLLAVTAYAGANVSRQLADLMKLILELHGPKEGDTTRPVVCTTCRDSCGRRVAFPCAEFIRSAEITDFTMDPTLWDELGVTLPASLRKPAAIEPGRQA